MPSTVGKRLADCAPGQTVTIAFFRSRSCVPPVYAWCAHPNASGPLPSIPLRRQPDGGCATAGCADSRPTQETGYRSTPFGWMEAAIVRESDLLEAEVVNGVLVAGIAEICTPTLSMLGTSVALSWMQFGSVPHLVPAQHSVLKSVRFMGTGTPDDGNAGTVKQ